MFPPNFRSFLFPGYKALGITVFANGQQEFPANTAAGCLPRCPSHRTDTRRQDCKRTAARYLSANENRPKNLAHANEHDMDYCRERRLWGWIRYTNCAGYPGLRRETNEIPPPEAAQA